MSEPFYTPDHIYSIDEFVGHFDYFVQSPEGTSRESLIRFFAMAYPNRSEGLYKLNRFGTAFAYMMRNLQKLDEFVVVGEEGKAVVAKPLVFAIARYFCPIPDVHLNDEHDPEIILEMAREEV